MKLNVKIRPGRSSDNRDVCRLFYDAFPFEYNNKQKRHFLEQIKKKEMLVAESSGTLTGFITFCKGFWSGDTLSIDYIIVDKDYRNRGIGGILLNRIIKMGKKKELRRIFLNTLMNNKKVVRFYLKRGFKRAGYTDNTDEEGMRFSILSRKVQLCY